MHPHPRSTGRMATSKRMLSVVHVRESGVADVPAAVSALLQGEGLSVLVTSPALSSRRGSLFSDAGSALEENDTPATPMSDPFRDGVP